MTKSSDIMISLYPVFWIEFFYWLFRSRVFIINDINVISMVAWNR